MDLNFKKAIHQAAQDWVACKIEEINKSLERIQGAVENETKSTAGDKHEVGRAMAHLEKEKLIKQLALLKKQEHLLRSIRINQTSQSVQLGSLIQTDSSIFYLSTSIGILEIEHKKVFVVSLSSPIGKLLFEKKLKDQFEFNKKTHRILTLL